MIATLRHARRYRGMSPYPTYVLPRFGLTLTLTWCHGAGFCPGLVQWRWRGRLVAVAPAGQA